MAHILFPVTESRSCRQPRSPAKTAGSRPAGRDLAVPRTERPDPGQLPGMVRIWPFPRPDRPDSGLFGHGTGRQGEWSGDSNGVLCFQHAVFTKTWKEHFCLYVLNIF
jgi:hypothetical protein